MHKSQIIYYLLLEEGSHSLSVREPIPLYKTSLKTLVSLYVQREALSGKLAMGCHQLIGVLCFSLKQL